MVLPLLPRARQERDADLSQACGKFGATSISEKPGSFVYEGFLAAHA